MKVNYGMVSMAARLGALIFMVALAGCATVVNNIDGARGNYLVEMALTQDPVSLKADADKGFAKPEYAYGLILEFGLQGVPKDRVAAEAYKQKATGQAGQVLQNGLAVGVHYEVNPIEASSAEECLAWLSNQVPLVNRDANFICGGLEGRQRYVSIYKTRIQ